MNLSKMTQQSNLPSCMYFPRFLYRMPCSSSSKLVYCLLLDKILERGQKDEHGHIYLSFSISEISNAILRESVTTRRLLKELEDYGLIKRKYRDAASCIYVFVPDEVTNINYPSIRVNHSAERSVPSYA